MKKQMKIVMNRRKSKEIIVPILPPKFVLFCFVVKIFSTLRLCSGVPQGPSMEPLVFFKPGPLSAAQMKYVTQRGNVSNGNNLCCRRIGLDLPGHPPSRGLNLFTR